MTRQIAALPLFVTPGGTLEVYLVTSRGSGRWIIPKGNPIRGLSPADAAAREALEEAGLVGRILSGVIGSFEFERLRSAPAKPCVVDVYPLLVEKQVRKFEEKRQRKIMRCDIETACGLVCSPSLAVLISEYGRQFWSERLAEAG